MADQQSVSQFTHEMVVESARDIAQTATTWEEFYTRFGEFSEPLRGQMCADCGGPLNRGIDSVVRIAQQVEERQMTLAELAHIYDDDLQRHRMPDPFLEELRQIIAQFGRQ